MSAKHALLGLLLHRSAYPYQLADRLQGRLGPTWKINSGQLYQTIERMERDGLIERVEAVEQGAEDRHVFAITKSGAEEFERWFDGAITSARLSRRPLLVKITLAGPERLKDVLEQLDAYELDCAAHMTELARMRDASPTEGPQVRADHVLLRLNLSADISQLEGELRWSRHAREMVSWLLTQPDAIWPSAPERSSGSTGAERQDARAEVFGKMASRHLRLVSDGQGRDH